MEKRKLKRKVPQQKKTAAKKTVNKETVTKKPKPASTKTIVPVKTVSTSVQETLYIANDAHYDQVIERIKDVKKTLWIGTADRKDLYVKDGRSTKPLLEVLSDLAKKRNRNPPDSRKRTRTCIPPGF